MPTTEECLEACLGWPAPCVAPATDYVECIAAAGPVALACDPVTMSLVPNPAYCGAEEAAVGACKLENPEIRSAPAGRAHYVMFHRR